MSPRRQVDIANPRTGRQLERAQQLHDMWRDDEHVAAHQRKERPVAERTPQGDIQRRKVDIDALDRLADETYTAASEALESMQKAQQRERAASADRSDIRGRFPAVGGSPQPGGTR